MSLLTQEVYWIIEGKGQRDRNDEKVQAKRKAAESFFSDKAIIGIYYP